MKSTCLRKQASGRRVGVSGETRGEEFPNFQLHHYKQSVVPPPAPVIMRHPFNWQRVRPRGLISSSARLSLAVASCHHIRRRVLPAVETPGRIVTDDSTSIHPASVTAHPAAEHAAICHVYKTTCRSISLILHLWPFQDEQASVVTCVCYRLSMPGSYFCKPTSPFASGRNYMIWYDASVRWTGNTKSHVITVVARA